MDINVCKCRNFECCDLCTVYTPQGFIDQNPKVIQTVPQGLKYDTGKIPLELLPVTALEEIAKALDFGKGKYGAWNWTGGIAWMRVIGALMRHVLAFKRGEDKDPESGLSHLAHAGCCILFLLTYEKTRKSFDDRYKEVTHEATQD